MRPDFRAAYPPLGISFFPFGMLYLRLLPCRYFFVENACTMNYLKRFLLLLAISATLVSCSLLDDNSLPNGSAPASGTWKVSYFYDKSDETSYYTGYTFEFSSDGKLTAANGSQIYTGAWSAGFDDSKNKFLINFNGVHPSALEDLEEDWLIIEQSSDFMHFKHTSGGNGNTDVLQFSKD